MLRCPLCRAALGGTQTCRRCKAELGSVLRAAAAARALMGQAMQAIATGDLDAARSVLRRGLDMHATPEGVALARLVREK